MKRCLHKERSQRTQKTKKVRGLSVQVYLSKVGLATCILSCFRISSIISYQNVIKHSPVSLLRVQSVQSAQTKWGPLVQEVSLLAIVIIYEIDLEDERPIDLSSLIKVLGLGCFSSFSINYRYKKWTQERTQERKFQFEYKNDIFNYVFKAIRKFMRRK